MCSTSLVRPVSVWLVWLFPPTPLFAIVLPARRIGRGPRLELVLVFCHARRRRVPGQRHLRVAHRRLEIRRLGWGGLGHSRQSKRAGEREERRDGQRPGAADKRTPRDTRARRPRRSAGGGCGVCIRRGTAAPAGRRAVRRRWRAALLPLPRRSHGLGARRSALGARRSALGARRSALGARRSALGARRSALGARRSALGARRSALGARRSALGARRS